MAKLDGVELHRAKLPEDQVVGVLDLILREITGAYDAGYIHADMSEYNVAVSEAGVTIFDWPQAVPTDHENARDLLDRDIANLLSYFERKYPGSVPDLDTESIGDAVAGNEFESVRTHAA